MTMSPMVAKLGVLRSPMVHALLALLLWPVDALLSLVPPTNLTQMAMPLMGAKLAVLRSPMVHARRVRLRWQVGALLSRVPTTHLTPTTMPLMDAKWAVQTYPLHHVSRARLILLADVHNCLRVRSTNLMPITMRQTDVKVMLARVKSKHFVILV